MFCPLSEIIEAIVLDICQRISISAETRIEEKKVRCARIKSVIIVHYTAATEFNDITRTQKTKQIPIPRTESWSYESDAYSCVHYIYIYIRGWNNKRSYTRLYSFRLPYATHLLASVTNLISLPSFRYCFLLFPDYPLFSTWAFSTPGALM